MDKLSHRPWALSICLLALAALATVSAGCGDSDDWQPPLTAAPTATAARASTPEATPSEPPTELRVAYINLLHPVGIDVEDTVAADTADERVAAVIEELDALDPDIVVVSEASRDAVSALLAGLKMEYWVFQSNPWLPGQSRDEAKALSEQLGFWEGDAVFVSARYIHEGNDIHQLNPRTSQSENRSVGHVVVKGPDPVGRLNLYVVHLTDGSDAARAEQARDALSWIEQTRGEGAVLVFGDLSSSSDSTTYGVMVGDGGLRDAAASAEDRPEEGTCCRAAVLGQQEPLTATTAYIFSREWLASSVQVFGATPRPRADGQLLYPSDQNGLFAVFPLEPAPPLGY